MRILMKVAIPIETGNAKMKDGSLPKIIQSILNELKPEAAYFTEFNGERTGIIVVDVKEPSDIPGVAEPLFLALNARVEFHPAMKPEDLQKAGPAIEKAVKNYS